MARLKLLAVTMLLGLSMAVETFNFGIVYSEKTPQSVHDKLANGLSGLAAQVRNALNLPFELGFIKKNIAADGSENWTWPKEFMAGNVFALLDIAGDAMMSQFLAFECQDRDAIHIVLERSLEEITGESVNPTTLFFEPNYVNQAKAFLDIVTLYGWSNLALIYDQQPKNIELADQFKKIYDPTTQFIKDELVVDSDDPTLSTRLTHRLESTTKDSGARVILIFSGSVLASQLLFSGDESVMGGSGYAWILNSSAMKDLGEVARMSHADQPTEKFGVLKTGVVGFLEEDADYLEEYDLAMWESVLTLTGQYIMTTQYTTLGVSALSGAAMRTYVDNNPSTPTLAYAATFLNGARISQYNIHNIQDFSMYLVGSWSQITREVTISDAAAITWPGFKNVVPNDKIPIVTIALLVPLTNPDGSEYAPGKAIENGFYLALNTINNDPDVLGSYLLEASQQDTLQRTDMASGNIKRLTNSNPLGYIGPLVNEVTAAYLAVLQEQLDPKPLVSYGTTAKNFTNVDQHDRFLRTIQPDGLQAAAIALFIQQQGWNKVAVLYTDDAYGQGVHDSFLTNVEGLDVTIENDAEDRVISCNQDGTFNSATKDDVEEQLTQIVRNQLKVIVYLGGYRVGAEVAKVAREKELWGVDYGWLGGMWLNDEMLAWIDAEYSSDKDDIMDVLNGAIGVDNRVPQGDQGTKFAADYLAAYGTEYTTYAMYAYDTVYMFAWTIDSMIERGEDFNNGTDMTDSLRAVDFTGASGKVKIFEGTNDRSAIGYSIVNMQDGVVVHIADYDPLNPNIFTFTEGVEIEWGDGASSEPEDEWSGEEYPYDCPFAYHMSSIYVPGLITVVALGTGLLGLTLFLSWFSFKKWKQVGIQPITEPVVRSWKDTMVQATIFIEFFQFIAIAPDFAALSVVIRILANLFLIDIIKMANEDKSGYWTLLIVIVIIAYIWFVLVLLIMLNAERCLSKLPFIQRTIALLNSVYLPFFGNTMFLPFSALLLDPFVCDHIAQGKPYVWRDCYMNCWEGVHVDYVIMASIGLTVYEPIAVFSRPLWQQAKTGLNIMAKPFFLLVKTCVQILLIAVGKSLKGITPIGHGVVFSFLVLCFAFFTRKIQPFNYHRCNLWEFLSLMAVFYISLLATLSNVKDPEHYGWFIALCIGWAAIAMFGFIWQRKYYKNLLVPPGGGKSKRKIYDALNFSRGQSMDLSKDQSALEIDSPSAKVGPQPFMIEDDNEDESPSSGSASQSASATPSSELHNPSPQQSPHAGTIQEEEEKKSEESDSESSSSSSSENSVEVQENEMMREAPPVTED